MNITEWLDEYLDEKEEDGYTRKNILKDITEHGCQSGIIGELIYYKDTVKFYDEHEVEIWNRIIDSADNLGVDSNTFISKLNGSKDVMSGDQHKNLLTWFAVEEVAFELSDG
tara:strand:+ start:1488 stop:1823 length:336 start_codon:yes stop_codon:yes gene_type:complete